MFHRGLCWTVLLLAALSWSSGPPAFAQDEPEEPRGLFRSYVGGLSSGGDIYYLLGAGWDAPTGRINEDETGELRNLYGASVYLETTSKNLGDAFLGFNNSVNTVFLNYNYYPLKQRVFFTGGIGLSISTLGDEFGMGLGYNAGVGIRLSAKKLRPDLRLKWSSHKNGKVNGLALVFAF